MINLEGKVAALEESFEETFRQNEIEIQTYRVPSQLSDYKKEKYLASDDNYGNIGTFSITNNEKTPWWKLGYSKYVSIKGIKVYNRYDGWKERLINSIVLFLDVNYQIVWEVDIVDRNKPFFYLSIVEKD